VLLAYARSRRIPWRAHGLLLPSPRQQGRALRTTGPRSLGPQAPVRPLRSPRGGVAGRREERPRGDAGAHVGEQGAGSCAVVDRGRSQNCFTG
jgi:hypothetical protein